MPKLFYFLITFVSFISFGQDEPVLSIYFNKTEYAINQINQKKIKDLALKNKQQNFKIIGYTDNDGSVDDNLELSKKRANSVKSELIKNGINPKNFLLTEGKGEIQTGVKQFNRRVDIFIEYENVLPPEPVMEEVKQEKALNNYNAISKLQVGETIALEGINFMPGRHFLIPSAEPQLYQLLKVLKENPNLKVEIQGHICCMPSGEDGLDADTQTMDLSVNRAKYIYEYLIRNGIEENRLSYKGFGASKPLVEEITEADQIKNRRVEVMVTGS